MSSEAKSSLDIFVHLHVSNDPDLCCQHINRSFNKIYSIQTRMNWVLRVTRDLRKTNCTWVKIIIN